MSIRYLTPIEMIVNSVNSKRRFHDDRLPMDSPQIYMSYFGNERIPMRNEEFVDRFPYVAYFTYLDEGWQNKNSEWDKNKNNPRFIENLEELETELRLVTSRVENLFKECFDENKYGELKSEESFFSKINYEGIDFPYLIDFLKNEKDFYVSRMDYDWNEKVIENQKKFTDLFVSLIKQKWGEKETTDLEDKEDFDEEIGER